MKSREEYIKQINDNNKNNLFQTAMWSEPMYECPKCKGNMRKNLINSIMLACNPPITRYEYRCQYCGFMEYLKG